MLLIGGYLHDSIHAATGVGPRLRPCALKGPVHSNCNAQLDERSAANEGRSLGIHGIALWKVVEHSSFWPAREDLGEGMAVAVAFGADADQKGPERSAV